MKENAFRPVDAEAEVQDHVPQCLPSGIHGWNLRLLAEIKLPIKFESISIRLLLEQKNVVETAFKYLIYVLIFSVNFQIGQDATTGKYIKDSRSDYFRILVHTINISGLFCKFVIYKTELLFSFNSEL